MNLASTLEGCQHVQWTAIGVSIRTEVLGSTPAPGVVFRALAENRESSDDVSAQTGKHLLKPAKPAPARHTD
jgi:hypothetical protein